MLDSRYHKFDDQPLSHCKCSRHHLPLRKGSLARLVLLVRVCVVVVLLVRVLVVVVHYPDLELNNLPRLFQRIRSLAGLLPVPHIRSLVVVVLRLY